VMSSVRQLYRQWIIRHYRWVVPVCEMSRQLTLFLPGRYAEGELRSEFVYSFLNLIQIVNQNSLKGVVPDIRKSYVCDLKCGSETDDHYVRWAKDAISLFYYTEVFLEMLADKYLSTDKNKKPKWAVVTLIEFIKALCHFYLLRNNQWRMLRPHSAEEEKIYIEEEKAKENLKKLEQIETENRHENYALAKLYVQHGRIDSIHGNFSPQITHYRESSQFRPPLREIFSEILHWARPLVLALGRWGYGEHSWIPLICSGMVDIVSRFLQARYDQLSDLQKLEVNRRTFCYLYYLVRNPIFDQYTKAPIVWFCTLLSKIPLLGFIISPLLEAVLALQKHYFYTSAS